ncbi:MAG: ParB N-terminal domain-containing protein [Actinomycetota bacterium]|nr:ParB N-terminal domain-containing protein [Actinomycetota bacterium]
MVAANIGEQYRRSGHPDLLFFEGGFESLKVAIKDIEVGERRREDYGNIPELAESIERYGLIQPIVLAEGNRLVAGGRRLEAVKRLGWSEVDARSMGELAEAELREIEAEENERRKDLTPYELSKRMVRKARKEAETISTAAVEIKPEAISSPCEEKDPRGRKSDYGVPKKDAAQAAGLSTSALVRAEQHVAAVEKYPELKDASQSRAIEVSRHLDELPESEREEGRKALRGEPTVGEILGDEAEEIAWNTPWDVPPEGKEYRKIIKWVVRMDGLDMDKVASYCKDEYEVERDLEYVRKWREVAERAEKAFQKRRQELRPGNLRAVK